MSATVLTFVDWQESVMENLRVGINLLGNALDGLPPNSSLLSLCDSLTAAREAWKAGDSEEVERLAWAHQEIAQHRERQAEAVVRARWAPP